MNRVVRIGLLVMGVALVAKGLDTGNMMQFVGGGFLLGVYAEASK